MKIDSPRGPLTIDAGIRDVVQTQYIRRVEKRAVHSSTLNSEAFRM
jgi:hypothetical protein